MTDTTVLWLQRKKHLVEEVEHGLARTLGGALVVGDSWYSRLTCKGMGEAVHDTSVDVHLPVDRSVAHFCLECCSVIEWNDRIVGADTHQDRRCDVGAIAWADIGESGMESDNRFQVRACSTEFER